MAKNDAIEEMRATAPTARKLAAVKRKYEKTDSWTRAARRLHAELSAQVGGTGGTGTLGRSVKLTPLTVVPPRVAPLQVIGVAATATTPRAPALPPLRMPARPVSVRLGSPLTSVRFETPHALTPFGMNDGCATVADVVKAANAIFGPDAPGSASCRAAMKAVIATAAVKLVIAAARVSDVAVAEKRANAALKMASVPGGFESGLNVTDDWKTLTNGSVTVIARECLKVDASAANAVSEALKL
jgi:hypothetical protein